MPDNNNYPAFEMSLQQAHFKGRTDTPGPVADGDNVVPPPDVFAPRQFHDQGFVHRGDGWEVEGVQALHRGEVGSPDPPLHHALVAVDELQFRQSQQVPWMVHPPRPGRWRNSAPWELTPSSCRRGPATARDWSQRPGAGYPRDCRPGTGCGGS